MLDLLNAACANSRNMQVAGDLGVVQHCVSLLHAPQREVTLAAMAVLCSCCTDASMCRTIAQGLGLRQVHEGRGASGWDALFGLLRCQGQGRLGKSHLVP